jgi:hypothetical protein
MGIHNVCFYSILGWMLEIQIFLTFHATGYNFHLSESSFTCPGLRASGLARRLDIWSSNFLVLGLFNIENLLLAMT